ncbi:MAG: DUF2892 domain-containing protein, partial [Candidatus Kapaibacterium sp.]
YSWLKKEYFMNPFVSFMRSGVGRGLRIVLGLFLIWWGFWGDAGVIVGIIGFVPLLAGIFNFCVFAPLFGYTFMGQPRHQPKLSH